MPYLPGDKLALNFGGHKGMDCVTPDQVRRLADSARLPLAPLWRTVKQTCEATGDAWGRLAEKELLTGNVVGVVSSQVDGCVARTAKAFSGAA